MPSVTLPSFIREPFIEAVRVYLILLRILVPTILIVKALETLGGIEQLGALLSPVMGILGLPDAFGIVWAATMLTSIVPGMVIFASLAAEHSPSVSQVTVLGTLMLLAHSLPVEGAVARRAGVPWLTTLTLRIGGALILGFLVHGFYVVTDSGHELISLDWVPVNEQDTLLFWASSQLQTLAMIFLVIYALVVLLRTLRRIRLEPLLHRLLTPPLRLIGIGPAAANVIVIGLVLGLSYGAGLLIRDVDNGTMSARDSYLALCFLGLAHSMIDDTLLVMLLGANIVVCVVVRVIFAISVIAVMSRYWRHDSPNSKVSS